MATAASERSSPLRLSPQRGLAVRCPAAGRWSPCGGPAVAACTHSALLSAQALAAFRSQGHRQQPGLQGTMESETLTFTQATAAQTAWC